MLLTEKGLHLPAFDASLASLIGNSAAEPGANLLVEATRHQHRRVELWDWFYLLLKAPMKTAVRVQFIETPGMKVEQFIEDVEAAFDLDEDNKGMPPADLVPSSVSPAVLRMLERAEELAREHRCPNVSEWEVTLALLEHAGDDMSEFLTDVMDREKDGLGQFERLLFRRVRERGTSVETKVTLFEDPPSGQLRQDAFLADGRTFCKRWREDMASMGVRMDAKPTVTTRHLLYSILGNANGPLAVALSTFGVTVKDLHAALARELTRPGRKRSDDFALVKGAMFDSVAAVLVEAHRLARERDVAGIGEIDVHKAFVAKQGHELRRVLPREGAPELATIADFLEESQPSEDETKPLQRFTVAEMRDRINNKIFGQPTAVAQILPWIQKLRFGRTSKTRPAGVFLFLGPTGTGKTQLGKELARYVYGNEDELLFFEMGQFKGEESMTIFVGAPPGYKGYGEGQLTNGLRDHPECVVLFDEIEKAEAQVFDALLRFTDEGRISDPSGPVRDGRKCIIVLTSNAGQDWLRAHLDEHPEAREDPESLRNRMYDEAMKDLRSRGFRPEALGRVDERVVFFPFSLATCRQIVDAVLDPELAQFRDENAVRVEVPADVRDFLANEVFARAMDEGARGAPRAVTKHVVSPVIERLVPFQEQGERMPRTLIAVLLGKAGHRADEQSPIEWEVEE